MAELKMEKKTKLLQRFIYLHNHFACHAQCYVEECRWFSSGWLKQSLWCTAGTCSTPSSWSSPSLPPPPTFVAGNNIPPWIWSSNQCYSFPPSTILLPITQSNGQWLSWVRWEILDMAAAHSFPKYWFTMILMIIMIIIVYRNYSLTPKIYY